MSGYIPGPAPAPLEGLEDFRPYRTISTRVMRYVSPLVFFFRIGLMSELGAREFVRRYRVYYFSLLTRLMLTGWLPLTTGEELASNWEDNTEIELDGIKYYLRKGRVFVKTPTGEEVETEARWLEPYWNRNRFEALATELTEAWAKPTNINEGSYLVFRKIGEKTGSTGETLPVVECMYELSRYMIKGSMSDYHLYRAEYDPDVKQVLDNIDRMIITDDNYAEALYQAGRLPEKFVTESGYDPTTGWFLAPEERFQRLFDIAYNYIWGADHTKNMWAVVSKWFVNARQALEEYLSSAGVEFWKAYPMSRAIYHLIKFQTWVDRSFEGPSGWFNRLVWELSRRFHWYEPLAEFFKLPLDSDVEWELTLEIPYLHEVLGLRFQEYRRPTETLLDPGVKLVEGHLIPALPERITKKTTKIYAPVEDENGNRIVLVEGEQYTIRILGYDTTAIFRKGKIRYLPASARDPKEEETGYFEVPPPNPVSSSETVYVVNGYVYKYEDVPGHGRVLVVCKDNEGNPIVSEHTPLKWYSRGEEYTDVIDPDTGQPLDVSKYVNQVLSPPKIDEFLEVKYETVDVEYVDGSTGTITTYVLKIAGEEENEPKHAYITYYKDGNPVARLFVYDYDSGRWVETQYIANYRVVDSKLQKRIPEGEVVWYLAEYYETDMYYWNQGWLLRWHIFNLMHFIYGLFLLICHGDSKELLSLIIMVYLSSSAEDLNRCFSVHFSDLEWQQVGQLIDVFSDVSEIFFNLLGQWRRTRVFRGLFTARLESIKTTANELKRYREMLFTQARMPGENPSFRAMLRTYLNRAMGRLHGETTWVAAYDPTQGRFPFISNLILIGIWHFYNFASALQVIAKTRQQYYDQLLEERGWVTAAEQWQRELVSEANRWWTGIFSGMSTFFSMVFILILWALPFIVSMFILYLLFTRSRMISRMLSRASLTFRNIIIRRWRRFSK